MKALISFLVRPMFVGCGGTGGADDTEGQVFSADPPLVIGGDERPAEVDIPTNCDPTVPHPLVMALHGFGADGRIETGHMQLFDFVDEKQFVLVFPDGTVNDQGERFWHATAACCDPGDSVDEVGYLSGLIDEVKQTYNIDPKRVNLIGHSNGGFMSFQTACEASGLITAIVSLAGSSFDDPASKAPKPTRSRTRPAAMRGSMRRSGRSTTTVISRSFRPSLPRRPPPGSSDTAAKPASRLRALASTRTSALAAVCGPL